MTLSAEDGTMESRTHGPLHTGPVFSRSAKTSWPYSQAGLVEDIQLWQAPDSGSLLQTLL